MIFPQKFGIPRQSGLVDSLISTIVFEPEFRNPDAFRGLDGYSHIWLLWQFFRGGEAELVSDCEASPAGRKYQNGRFSRLVRHSAPMPLDYPVSGWKR